jgi:hypothetical protein
MHTESVKAEQRKIPVVYAPSRCVQIIQSITEEIFSRTQQLGITIQSLK